MMTSTYVCIQVEFGENLRSERRRRCAVARRRGCQDRGRSQLGGRLVHATQQARIGGLRAPSWQLRVRKGVRREARSQEVLLQRIPAVPHLKSAWLILQLCGAPRANYLLRILPPCQTLAFACEHDLAVLRCLGSSWAQKSPSNLATCRVDEPRWACERGRSAAH